MKTPRMFALAALAMSVVVSVPFALGETETKKDEGDAKRQEQARAKAEARASAPSKVFTNEDLDRLFGSSDAPPTSVEKATAANGGTPEGDPLAAVHEQQAKDADRQNQIALAEGRVAEAQARVGSLEKRSIEISNPYLPRPQLTPEETEAWKNLDGQARLKQNQAEIEQAKKAVEDAKRELDTARAGGN